jgi:acyl carrier protein
MSENELRLRTILSSVLQVSLDSVTDDTSMASVDAWDSLRHMSLVLALEEEFDVVIDELIAFDIVSLGLIRQALKDLGITF